MQTTTHNRVINILELLTGRANTAESIKPEDRFTEDLHCDSPDMVEIALALEEEFGIEIDEDRLTELLTVQSLINHIADLITKPSADVSTLRCISHHNACDCREHAFSVLIKAALDAAKLLDHAKNPGDLRAEEREEAVSVRDRLYAACETIFPQGEDDTEMARRLLSGRVMALDTAAGMTCCAEEVVAGPGWSAVQNGVAA